MSRGVVQAWQLLEQTTLVSGVAENKVFAEGSANVKGRKSVLLCSLQPSFPLCLTVLAAEQAAEGRGLPRCPRYLAPSLLPKVTHLPTQMKRKLGALQAGGRPLW